MALESYSMLFISGSRLRGAQDPFLDTLGRVNSENVRGQGPLNVTVVRLLGRKCH